MKGTNLEDSSTGPTAIHTIATQKIFIENSQFIYSNSWDVITNYLNELNDTNIYCFAEDKTYIDKKTNERKFIYNYYAIDYNTIYELSKQKKFHLYETYEQQQNIKLFLDIDIPINKIPDDYEKENKQKYLDMVIDDIIELVNDNLIKINKDIKSKIIILKSSSDNKLSSHIIYQNVIFDDIYHLRYFMSNIKSPYIDNKILDPNVYKKGCFRLLWNSKIKKNINLEYEKSYNYNYINDRKLFYDCLLRNISENSYTIKIDIPKILTIKKITKTIQNKLEKNDVYNEIYSINYLKRYVDILDVERRDNYIDWIHICACIINCNSTQDGFNLWHEWSKPSDKYISESDCINQWNIISQRKYNYGIGTLKYYAMKDNPDEYKKIEASNDLPIFDSIKFKKPYLLDNTDDRITNNGNIVCKNIIEWYNSNDIKSLCIRSCYNSGKTKILERIFEDLNFKRILFISYRQSLTNDIYGNFKKYRFKSYLDKIYNSNRIICQIESLHKLDCDDETDIPEYDLVIMDESESLLNHFRSKTIDEKEKTFELMKNIIFNSKKLLMLDGDFDNRSFTFCDYFGKSIILENQCKKDTKHFIYTNHRKYFEKQIENDLKSGLNIIICSMSSKLATYYNKLFKDKYKTILHCSDSDDILKNNLKDVKNFWDKYQLLIYSPSVESGVNFDKEHYDKIYIVLSTNSTSQRGLLQMMARVRKLKDSNIFVYLNNIQYSDITSFYKYDEIKNYLIETNKLNMKSVLDPKTNKMIRTYDFDLYNKILTYNIQEESNKNKNIFVRYFNYLLELKGHTHECLDYKINKNNIVKENVLLDEILIARDITSRELHTLLNKQANNKASHEDKILIERYMAIKKLRLDEIELYESDEDDCSDLDESINKVKKLSERIKIERNIRNNLLEKHYCNISKVESLRLLNNKIEKKNDDKPDDKNVNTLNEYDNNMNDRKLKIIIDIINKLGYEDLSDKKLIERSNFESNMNKVIKESELFINPHTTNPLFGLNKKINKIKSIKSFLGFINSLFIDYGFKIKVKQKSVRINKEKVNSNYYYISFVNDVNELV